MIRWAGIFLAAVTVLAAAMVARGQTYCCDFFLPDFDNVGNYRADYETSKPSHPWTQQELEDAFVANPTAQAWWVGTHANLPLGNGQIAVIAKNAIDNYFDSGPAAGRCPMIDFRADVVAKFDPSSTLTIQDQYFCYSGTSPPTHDPVNNVCAHWDGSLGGIPPGGTDSFDTDWILNSSEYATYVADIWNADDPCVGGTTHDFGGLPLDVSALCTNHGTPAGSGPVFYGTVGADGYFDSISGVVLDLRITAAQDHMVAQAEEVLDQAGIGTNDCGFLRISFKQAWHAYYGPGGDGVGCHETMTPTCRSYDCYAHPTCEGTDGGPLMATQFAEGEYETAMSSFIEKLRTQLDSTHPNVEIVLVDRPQTGRKQGVGYTPAARKKTAGIWQTQVAVATASGIDLGDLNVPSANIKVWYPAAVAENTYDAAQSWVEYDVTCSSAPCGSGKLPFTDLTGVSGCSAVTTSDTSGFDCIVDGASNDEIVLYLPAGTYSVDEHADAVSISRDNLVIRGAGRTQTILDVDDAVTGQPFDSGCSATSRATITICDGSNVGTWEAWTANYSAGDSTVTVTDGTNFTEGGWIVLRMDGEDTCELVDVEGGGSNNIPLPNAFTHAAIITSISSNDVTMDRPLRFDYDATGCAGFEAAPFAPSVGVGIEDLAIQASHNHTRAHAYIEGSAYFWIVGNKFGTNANKWVAVGARAVRGWIQGNEFTDLDPTIDFETGGVSIGGGSDAAGPEDLVVENNVISDANALSMNRGSHGTVMAYNYAPLPDLAVYFAQNGLYVHGSYTSDILFEGNDTAVEMMLSDGIWGRSGTGIVAYRNRQRGDRCSKGTAYTPYRNRDSIVINTDCASWNFTPDVDAVTIRASIIGNSVGGILTQPIRQSSCPDAQEGAEGACNATNITQIADETWIERNVYRNDFVPGNTDTDRSCGTALNDTCPGTNVNQSTPLATGGNTYPVSLYRDSSDIPSWWCQEACDWDDVTQGIGAWGDDFTGTLCKLPAQILAESGTCTAP